jgi:serine protease inhibitor
MTQVAKIKVNHEGTEAAAVTETVKSLAMEETTDTKYITLDFDKPFIYFIEDTTNNDYIFIGRMENFN